MIVVYGQGEQMMKSGKGGNTRLDTDEFQRAMRDIPNHHVIYFNEKISLDGMLIPVRTNAEYITECCGKLPSYEPYLTAGTYPIERVEDDEQGPSKKQKIE